jgi:hypothetical protein
VNPFATKLFQNAELVYDAQDINHSLGITMLKKIAPCCVLVMSIVFTANAFAKTYCPGRRMSDFGRTYFTYASANEDGSETAVNCHYDNNSTLVYPQTFPSDHNGRGPLQGMWQMISPRTQTTGAVYECHANSVLDCPFDVIQLRSVNYFLP